ncbi:MAG TPA: ABC transporter permease [Gammaproteobacteria bacterium]|nr:ABC transporter permease [Gammaproteobacteria bacterium]
MNTKAETITASRDNVGISWRRRDTLGVYWREALFQCRTMLRSPAFALPTLLFPVMFYLFFAVLFNRGDGAYFLATYGTFGVMGPALFGFGVGVAMEREYGVLALKRVFPLPAMAYFFARIAVTAVFAFLIVVMLSIMAITLAGVVLAPAQWLALGCVLVAGTAPFCALGLVVGLSVNGQAAAPVVNLIYLPMSFLSGLWVPIQLMPHFLQQFALALPAYHLGQLALVVADHGDPANVPIHAGYLAAFTIVCLLIAARGWRRIQDR